MIRAIKLKTGEELICDIEGVTKVGEKEVCGEEVIFNKPMTIHMIPSEEGIGLQLLPWAIYLKDHVLEYPGSEVNFCKEPSTSVRNQYAQMTGLPIIPDNSIITETEDIPNLKLST